MILPQVEELQKSFEIELSKATTTSLLEAVKVSYLGRKGPVQELMKFLKDVPTDQRPAAGKVINELKDSMAIRISQKQSDLLLREENERLKTEGLDISLPGRRRYAGRKHVVLQVMEEMVDILVGMGFSVQYGPDVETDFYNFEALNFTADHPARDMQDTFYITDKVLLRTHTSNVQVRVMEANQPPIRVIAPGKAFRNETITPRSHVFFHQIEGFYIDRGVSFADLQATVQEFLSKLFHVRAETRFRPSYFPFVEPGMEVDLRCLSCNGEGCQLCKHTGWLEVLGAGMIHPEVLKNGNIDPEVYSGYAWGMGVERVALLKYGIKDIRMFSENDMRFLCQFTT